MSRLPRPKPANRPARVRKGWRRWRGAAVALLFFLLGSTAQAQRVTFDVYPSDAVVYREVYGEPGAWTPIGAPGFEISLKEKLADQDQGVMRVKVDTDDGSRVAWYETYQNVSVPANAEKQVLTRIYLHPKNKLDYLRDFETLYPLAFRLTALGLLGLLGIPAAVLFRRREAARRAQVLAAVGAQYHRPLGQWLAVASVGAGGMGEVLKGFPIDDVRLEKLVAIKLRAGIDTSQATSEMLEREAEDRQRFRTEVRVLGSLDHPGIVKIHDWGEIDGKDYFVMDLVQGESLQSYLDRSPRLSYREVQDLFLQLLEIVDFAHKKGVLHRDLKPLNVLRNEKGRLVVIDFGLARDQNQSVAFTQQGMPMVGSLDYMDPRVALQMFQRIPPTPSDEGTDQFALGSILFLLLTGKPALELPKEMDNHTLLPVLMKIGEPRPSPRTVRPDLPEPLDQVVSRMLAVEASERFASLEQARDALLEAMRPLVS